MDIKVTKSFMKDLKKDPQLAKLFEKGAEKALDGITPIREKTKLPGIFSMDLPGGNRVLMAKDPASGDLIPFFIGSHAKYDKVLDSKPKVEAVLNGIITKSFNKISGNVNHLGALIGRTQDLCGKAAHEFLEKLGKRGGLAAGIVVGSAIFLKTGDAKAALEQVMPGGSSLVAAMDGKSVEAVLAGIEELPLGAVATEFLRPLIRAIHDPDSVEPGMLESVADALFEKYQYEIDPETQERFNKMLEEVGYNRFFDENRPVPEA